jgi:hypothetical protein
MCERDVKFLPWRSGRTERDEPAATHALDVEVSHGPVLVRQKRLDGKLKSGGNRLQELSPDAGSTVKQGSDITDKLRDADSLCHKLILIRELSRW